MTPNEQPQPSRPTILTWKKGLVAIFLAALALRIGVVAVKWPDPKAVLTELNDSTDYDWLAQSLLRGDGFAAPCGKATAFRPPLYPVFLAAVYSLAGVSNLGAVALTQAVLGALAALLAALAARRAGLGSVAALLAGALTAIYPAFLFQTPQILTETLSQTLVIALALALLSATLSSRAALWIDAGILFALAALNKSVLVAALPFLALWIFWLEFQHRGATAAARSLAFFILPVVLLIGGWSVRNAVVSHGAFIPVSSNFPITFAQGVTRHSYYTRIWYGEARCMPSPDDYLRLTQMRSYCGIDEELQIGRDYEARALGFIAERPAWFAALTLRKAFHFWGPFIRSTPAQSAVALLTMGPVLLAGWIAAVWILIRRHPATPFAWLALAIAIPVTLPHALSQCDVRYRLGLIDPLWILLAASLLDLLRPMKKEAFPGSQSLIPKSTPDHPTVNSQRTTDNGPWASAHFQLSNNE